MRSVFKFMQVISNIDALEQELEAKFGSSSGIRELLESHTVEVVKGWAERDTVRIFAFDFNSFQIEGINETDLTPQVVKSIKDYLLSDKSEFSPNYILSIFDEDADCGTGISWETMADAVHEAYSADELIAFIKEAYTDYINITEEK